jgi:uncharacterized protein involved in oxidation of intracellular sulfur
VKYLLVINGGDPETVWNGLRFGLAALSRGHEASAFLLGGAVEIERLGDECFDVEKQLQHFDEFGGVVLSCGACLRIRKADPAGVCRKSTMNELARLAEEADRVFTFG